MSVSSGAVHAANHGVPRLCSEHRRRTSQRSPQCTAVPQNHGWRKVMSTPHRLELNTAHCREKNSTLDEGGTHVMSSNNRNYLRFGKKRLFLSPNAPWSCFLVTSFFFFNVATEDLFAQKLKSTSLPDILRISHKLFQNVPFFSLFVCLASIRKTGFFPQNLNF